MDSLSKLLLTSLLLLLAWVEKTKGDAMISGTVFCDQCKDGHISLFDYPLYGMQVRVTCNYENGVQRSEQEVTTNMIGGYTARFEGEPDQDSCYAQLSGNGQGSTFCGAAAGPAQKARLMFSMFGMEMYSVDSLLSQPAQPMSICPRSSTPLPGPVVGLPRPVTPRIPPAVGLPSPPVVGLPRPVTPRSPPPFTVPPMPFFQASACPHEMWTMPQYRCHWRFVNPDTKVAVAFGLIAARRYGTDMNLWQGIQGRGDIYRTLLREGTTSLLNSYNSIQFRYPTLEVIGRMNSALMGSPREALLMALRFKRANSGYGTNAHCNLTPCRAK